MTLALAERQEAAKPQNGSAEAGLAIEANGFSIFRAAKYALRWNIPEVAEDILTMNQARVAKLERQAKIGSPGGRAETRHILAKARGEVTKLRRLGLSSGSNEEYPTGMILAVVAEPEKSKDGPTPIRTTPNPDIGYRNKPLQWWYLPFAEIERVVALSHGNNIADKIDPYVFRAATGLVYTQDGSKNLSDNQIHPIDLDPVAASGLKRVAEYMKDNGIQGRIPSRREILIQEILHSGQFPTSNVRSLSTIPASSQEAVRSA